MALPTHYCDLAMGCGTHDRHTAAVTVPPVFVSSLTLRQQVSILSSVRPWCSVLVHAPYPAAAPIAVTVTRVLWPRRSVSRSQQ